MKVTVVGTGNVGAALLFPLAYNDAIDRVTVISRKRETAYAAIMDVASALPQGAAKMAYGTIAEVSESDVIVITSGVTQKGKTSEQTYGPNLRIAESVIQGAALKDSAVVICVATPVDSLTVDVQQISHLPAQQVIGFGGDLDSNRLQYILRTRNLPHEDAAAIGEHGPNAIPVYKGEQHYDEVTQELHQFWLRIAKQVDVVRNLATADLLGKLVDSIVTDAKTVHNVCSYHPEHEVYLTWPCVIGQRGSEQTIPLMLSPRASTALGELVGRRRRLAAATLVI